MTNPRQAVTFRDIAEECGVSPSTVSRALRDHPRISPETKKRIKAAAKRMNYVCNPMVSALMSSMGRSRHPPDPTPLAVIYTYSAKEIAADLWHQTLWTGISRRAEELGFPIDQFFVDYRKIDSRRISEILISRGISGVIIPPASRGGSHLSMDWNRFSAVAIGYSMLRPNLDRVCSNQYQGMRLALKQLYTYGYERPGLFLSRAHDIRSLYAWSSGFYGYEHQRKQTSIIPFLEYDSTDDFLRWREKYRPDVIISSNCNMIAQTKLKCPEEVGFITLDYKTAQPEIAGVDEQVELLGEAAVDHLTQLLYHNKRGVPDVPRNIVIPQTWKDGASLPSLHAHST